MLRFITKLLVFLLTLGILSVAGAGAVMYWLVAVNPGPEIELSYIESILGRESPVYYRNGTDKIGVLFQDAHRQYLPYHLIPIPFVNAIVAAEDDQFFRHFGVDILGITRAMIANIRAGRIIQGGSTITQQTAKNLFKRESRTFKAKLKELLHAFQLEYYYSKEKILEFYVNQFFVSGNGHGLGVAARYYFDKEVNELTLLENAFIAGSVKRPNYYNPFTKSSKEAAERARKRAGERSSYVLGQMRSLGYITGPEYRQALNSDIVFRRGRMSFALNTVMDMVRDGLVSPEITEAFEEHGIRNVSTSGIKIITTVDKELQDETLYALRHELSRLDVRMRGYDRQKVRKEYGALEYPGDSLVQTGSFRFGRIEEISTGEDGKPRLRVSLGRNHPDGYINNQGLEHILGALVRYTRQRWSEVGKGDMKLLLEQLQEGDKVYVSVKDIELTGKAVLELERFPELQGGALIMQKGAIRAMAGGAENRYFNRAVHARRLMGSTFKPLLISAALQLGWSATDLLYNRRNVFVFQDRPYFPRPDHLSPHAFVSISWTGVKSENLAAIWLLYHLTDQLTPPRLREVAEYLDLAPREKDMQPESYESFKQRIRDKYGVMVNRDILSRAAYDRAVKNLEADFLFDDRAEEYSSLKQLPYGLHFDSYAEDIALKLENLEDKEKLANRERKELQLRLALLGRSFLGLRDTMDFLQQYKVYFATEKSFLQQLNPLAFLDSESGVLQPEGSFYKDENERILFSINEPDENLQALPEDYIRTHLGEMDNGAAVEEFWEQVWLEGYLSVYAYNQIDSQMERERDEFYSKKPYSMEVLSSVRDYRLLIGLQYLVHLGRELGIESELEPVLSFPLGSNVISLIDAVRMYESLVTGTNFSPIRDYLEDENEASGNGRAIIERIETDDGNEIYVSAPESQDVLDVRTTSALAHILHNTVLYGTGRYAGKNVRLKSTDPERQKILEKINLQVPLLGKTGTANQFRNAAFLGYVPVLKEGETEVTLSDGYSVGVYVGFDDNRQMVKGTTRITGAVGALPAWSSIASAVVNHEERVGEIDIADLSFNGLPLKYPENLQVFVPVDPNQGGTVISGRGALRASIPPSLPSILTYGRVGDRGHFEPDRFFRPYWKNMQ